MSMCACISACAVCMLTCVSDKCVTFRTGRRVDEWVVAGCVLVFVSVAGLIGNIIYCKCLLFESNEWYIVGCGTIRKHR